MSSSGSDSCSGSNSCARVPLGPDGVRRRPKALDLFCGAGGAGMGLHRAGFDVTGVDINIQPDYPFEFKQMSALDADVGQYDFVWASPPCMLYTGLIPREQREKHGHNWAHPDLIGPIRDMLVASGKPYVIENVAGAVRELQQPMTLCGTMFDLRVFRHRLFESNLPLTATRCCNHRNCGLGIHAPKYRTPPPGATLPGDWVVQDRIRKTGASAGQRDHYYVSPCGRVFRSFKSAYHVASHRDKPVDFKQFFAVYGTPGQRGSMDQWKQSMGISWMTHYKNVALAIPPAYGEFIGRQVLMMLGYIVDYPPLSYTSDATDLA